MLLNRFDLAKRKKIGSFWSFQAVLKLWPDIRVDMLSRLKEFLLMLFFILALLEVLLDVFTVLQSQKRQHFCLFYLLAIADGEISEKKLWVCFYLLAYILQNRLIELFNVCILVHEAVFLYPLFGLKRKRLPKSYKFTVKLTLGFQNLPGIIQKICRNVSM